MKSYDVIVIGGGLTGLNATRGLLQAGKSVLLIDDRAHLGGRLQTEMYEGLPLDHGFQVILTRYPQASKLLLPGLDVHPFDAGAFVRFGTTWQLISDPLQHPLDAFATLLSPIATVWDKILIIRLKLKLRFSTFQSIFSASNDQSTYQFLVSFGFSEQFIENFFRPFFGGVFLEKNLDTSSKFFKFVFKSFSEGLVAVPRQGIQQLIQSILPSAKKGCEVRLKAKVVSTSLSGSIYNVALEDGSTYQASKVVRTYPLEQEVNSHQFHAVHNYYFRVPHFPSKRPLLFLNGQKGAVINNLHLLNALFDSPEGEGPFIVSTTVLTDSISVETVQDELCQLFNYKTSEVELIQQFHIKKALKKMMPGELPVGPIVKKDSAGVFLGGDWLWNSSIEGSLESGAKVAQSVLSEL